MKDNGENQLELRLKNVGMLREAKVRVSDLSVIAGKNDGGKSSVGKVMMAIIKAYNMSEQGKVSKRVKQEQCKAKFNTMIDLLFDKNITSIGEDSSEISLFDLDKKTEKFAIKIRQNSCVEFRLGADQQNFFLDCTLIQTPLVWDMLDFFSSIKTMQVEGAFYKRNFDIKYPYILWDLYRKLTVPRNHQDANTDLLDRVGDIIDGEFICERDEFYFQRIIRSKIAKLPVGNLATGIKHFGILQTLLKNTYLTKLGFFVFDEPENHLHPAWQLHVAKLIVDLVSRGISIMINTHSPYMIESLYKYAKKAGVRHNFHLAQDGSISQIDDSNEKTLKQIFGLLNEVDERMDDEFDDEDPK